MQLPDLRLAGSLAQAQALFSPPRLHACPPPCRVARAADLTAAVQSCGAYVQGAQASNPRCLHLLGPPAAMAPQCVPALHLCGSLSHKLGPVACTACTPITLIAAALHAPRAPLTLTALACRGAWRRRATRAPSWAVTAGSAQKRARRSGRWVGGLAGAVVRGRVVGVQRLAPLLG